MCVCPDTATPDPHRTSCPTVMKTRAHTGVTVLSRTRGAMIQHHGPLTRTSSLALASPPLGANRQNTRQDLSPTGLKGPPYRRQGTATSPQPSCKSNALACIIHRKILSKEDLSLSLHMKQLSFCINFSLYSELLMLQCEKKFLLAFLRSFVPVFNLN